MIYLASPMASTIVKTDHSFSTEKLDRNVIIAQKLRAAGFDIYLPQENQQETQTKTLETELETIRNSEFLIILLSDTRGIYLEAGYAKGIGKKVYAVKVEETRAVSEWLRSFFEYLADDIDDLIAHLKK